MKPEDFIKDFPNNMKKNAILALRDSQSPELMQEQIKALTDIVYSLCQELETMRGLLKSKEILTEREYNTARKERMLQDHVGLGASP